MSGSTAPGGKQTACRLGGHPRKQTLLLVEPHRFLRETFNRILADQTDWEVIGQAESGIQAITQAVRLMPELVVMDLRLSDISGLVVTRLIRELVPQAQVILLIEEEACREYTEAALESGALACVVKTRSGKELVLALNEAVGKEQA